jgi:UDP-N-acetylglucosamine 2-epimerase (non-hydrolysing)
MTIKFIKKDKLKHKIAIIMGTRPGIIKMAPLVKESNQRELDIFIIHTGQHYSHNMDMAFFKTLGLPNPLHRVDSTKEYLTHAEQTAEMLRGVERALMETKPMVVLVCGDANTNLAAGLAARKLGMIVGHVESGLRSYDWSMPEEHNRVILDHISELLFAPTLEACNNLVADNVRGQIYLTGNTIVDSTLQNYSLAEKKIKLSDLFDIEDNNYILLTTHREENVDNKDRLVNILSGVQKLAFTTNKKVVYPVHPRTRKRLIEYNLLDNLLGFKEIILTEPVGYFEFLILIKRAALILTDSGGVQEEACILKTPCVTLRDNTERPETIKVGSNVLAGTDPDNILKQSLCMADTKREWDIPFGDGYAAFRIMDAVEEAMKVGISLMGISTKPRLKFDEKFELKKLDKKFIKRQ